MQPSVPTLWMVLKDVRLDQLLMDGLIEKKMVKNIPYYIKIKNGHEGFKLRPIMGNVWEYM